MRLLTIHLRDYDNYIISGPFSDIINDRNVPLWGWDSDSKMNVENRYSNSQIKILREYRQGGLYQQDQNSQGVSPGWIVSARS